MSYEETYSTMKTASSMTQAADILIESVSREDAFTCYIDVFFRPANPTRPFLFVLAGALNERLHRVNLRHSLTCDDVQ
jgi:hypothetical protein